MPVEYDFMKSAKEKEMPEEEYKTLSDELNKKADGLSNKLKKIILTLLGIYAVSFALLYLVDLFGDGDNIVMPYIWLAAEILLAIFLYDPKAEEDKKLKYETDKKILLNSIQSRIKMIKIKLGVVIGFGAIFLFLNGFVWWFNFIFAANTGEDLKNLADMVYRFM